MGVVIGLCCAFSHVVVAFPLIDVFIHECAFNELS